MGRLSLAMNLVPGLPTSCSRPDVLSTVGTKNFQLCPFVLLLEPGVLALSTVLSVFPASLIGPYIIFRVLVVLDTEKQCI